MSEWTEAFTDHLESTGEGNEYGYAISLDDAPTVPWPNIDQISLAFTGPVNVPPDALSIWGVNTESYAVTYSADDSTSNRATWAFNEPPGTDKLLIRLADSVTDVAGAAFDGDGDGTSGGDLQIGVNVVLGDTSRDNVTSIRDLVPRCP